MSTSKYMTREQISEWLKNLTLSDLEALAQAKGLAIGGSGKEGKVTKNDYVQAIGAKLVGQPTHLKVRSEIHYHNGMISGATDWLPGEERVVSKSAYQQMLDDRGPDFFQIVGRLVEVEV